MRKSKNNNQNDRPRDFDAMRALAQDVAGEVYRNNDGSPFIIPGHGVKVTRVEMVLRSWAQSTDFKKQLAFIEFAFGKVPIQTQIAGPNGKDLTPSPALDLSGLSDSALDELMKIIDGTEN